MTTVRDAAFAAHAAGLSVVPPRQDGSKQPIGEWERFQKRAAGLEQLRFWYQYARTGVGAVMGRVSGNLELLDFDERATHEAFLEAAAAAGLGELVDRIRAGYEEETPRGVHWLTRCETIAGNTKLAQRPKTPAEMKHPNDKVKTLIETRGEGGYAVLAPSFGSVNDPERPYRLLSGNFATIATITPEERKLLHDLARSFDQMPVNEHQSGGKATQGGGRPGDDFNQRADWADILRPHGWIWVYRRGDTDHWRRPGKDRGISASTNYAGSGLLYVFSTSTELEAERGYSKFSAYTFLNHGGDFSAATKVLASQGYGDQHRNGANGDGGDDQSGPSTATADTHEYHLTDLGNAERLVRDHGADLRYCETLGGWLCWDGRRWARDETGEVERRAKQVVRSLYREARLQIKQLEANMPDLLDHSPAAKEHRDKLGQAVALLNWALKSQSAARIAAMITLARSEPHIAVRSDEFDRDPWLLNCENGVLNLRTGQLLPHRREDLITKLAGCAYDPTATAPRWQAFLDRIMGGNEGLIAFLQRLVGYTLTGDTGEEMLALLYGTGRNGKTKFIEATSGVLGDYAKSTPFATFLHNDQDSVRNDIADLRGARFVSAVEPDEGRRLDEALIKQLTGGDTVKARFLFREYFEFRPAFKVVLAANHKPTVRGTDEGIWSRIRLVPFTVTIPKAERDKRLLEKLLAEAPGILTWAVEGCLAWQRDGLGEPQEVSEATETYRAEMDILASFLAECCMLRPDAQTAASELYKAFKGFQEQSGEYVLTQNAFGRRLTEKGFTRSRPGSGRVVWVGIGLMAPDRDEETETF